MLLRWSWGAGWRQVDAAGEGRQPQHEAPTPSLTSSGSKSTRSQAWAGASPQLYLSTQEDAALTSRRQSPSLCVSSSHTRFISLTYIPCPIVLADKGWAGGGPQRQGCSLGPREGALVISNVGKHVRAGRGESGEEECGGGRSEEREQHRAGC